MNRASPPTGSQGDIWRTAVATILNVVPYAMLAPQVVVHLSEVGFSATAVSMYGLTPFALILGMSVVMPRLLGMLGLGAAHLVGLVLATMALVGTALLLNATGVSLIPYIALAALLGTASALTWTATEAMIATRVPAHRIGALTALYQTGLGLAFAAGPFLPALLKLSLNGMAYTTGLIMGSAVLMSAIAFSSVSTARRETAPSSHMPFVWRLFGVVLIVAFVGGVFEVGLNAALPYVALENGMRPDVAVMLAGALACGALASQLPVGLLSDKVTTKISIRWCTTMLLVGLIALGSSSVFPNLLWVSAVLLGGAGGALYTLAMIEVARSRQSASAAALTSAAVSAYTFGGVVGPLGAGLLLDAFRLTVIGGVLGFLPIFVFISTFTQPGKGT